MKPQNKFYLVTTAILLSVAASTSHVHAVSLKELAGDKSGSNRSQKPTRIAADSMDIDFQNNNAVLTGNVDVDDPAVRIKCDKMLIYLQDKVAPAVEGKAEKSTKETVVTDEKAKTAEANEKSGENSAAGGNKELKTIVCIGNVVITRKLYDQGDISQGEQKAIAGKAVYEVKDGFIVLTEDKPTITRGKDSLSGNRITLWLDSERMKVEGGDRRAEINVENLKTLQSSDKK